MATSYSVEAVLRAVDKGFTSTMRQAQAQLDSFAKHSRSISEKVGKVADGMVSIGKTLSTSVTLPAVTAVGSIVKSFASLEQNLGGTKAVFGTFAKEVQTSATTAYKNMGLSASDYMATANKMGSLFQGSGISQRKSLELTSQAMQRAADVASVMGVDMKTAMESVAGAAKGNFTMMDNLGVAMNATTLEAYALEKGLNFKWDQATQAEKNELAMRMFFDRTSQYAGNFRKEAEDTVAGSFGLMKGAFDNLTAGLGQKDADVKTLLSNLFESVKFFADNVKRTLSNLWDNIPLSNAQKSLGALAVATGPLLYGFGKLGQGSASLLSGVSKLAEKTSGLGGTFTKVGNGFKSGFGTVKDILSPVSTIAKATGTHISDIGRAMIGVANGSQSANSALTFLTGGGRITNGLSAIATGFGNIRSKAISFTTTLPARFPLVTNAVSRVGTVFHGLGAKVSALGARFPVLSNAVGRLPGAFGTAFSGMGSAMTTFASLAMKALLPAALFGAFLVGLGLLQSQFGEQINQMANIAITQGPTVITNFINGIVSKIPELINQGTQLVQTLTNVIVANAPAIFQGAVALITALVQGVGNNATQLIGSAIQIIGVLVNGLLTALPQLLSVGMQFLVQLAQGVVNNLPLILSTAQNIILNFINSVSQNLPGIIQSGIQIIMTLVQGLIDNLPQIIQTAVTIIGALLQGIASALPQITNAGLSLIGQLASALITNASQILQAGWNLIKGLGQAMLEAIPQALQGVWDGIQNGFASVWAWVTGKNTEGAETTKAKITETATTVSAETSRMANDASVNATAMSTNMQSILDQLVANTNLQTGQMATDVGTQTSIMSNNAIANATTMTDGVNQSVAGINLDGLASIEQFSLNTAQNFATANQEATAQAQAINTNVSAQMDATAQSGQGAMTNFSSSVSSEMNKASQSATQSANRMSQAVTQSFNKMRTAASNVMSSLNNGFASGMSKMVSTVTQSGNKMKSTFQNTFNAIKAQTNSAMSNLQSRFSSGMNQVISLSQQAGSRVVQIFQSVAGQMQSAGYFAGMGFYNGLAGSAGAIYSLAASIANTVASTIRSALSIHSPSRVMRTIGGFTGEGMAIGMADWVPKIAKVSEKMAEVAMPDVAPIDMTATLKGNAKAVEQSLHSTLDVKQDKERQPIELVFDFGRRAFSAFVEDIFEEHDKQERIQVRMRPI